MLSTTRKDMWMNEALEIAMDTIEKRTHFSRKASKSWNIPMNSLFNHLNGETKSKKMGPRGVLIEEEDSIVIAWTLAMQECGLCISLQQLKMKVTELT
jgi:hypothetical protein